MSSFFEVQRSQQRRTVMWLAIEVAVLTGIVYFVSLPWQYWQSCAPQEEPTFECRPITYQNGITLRILIGVLVYLALALVVAHRRANPANGRPPTQGPQEQRVPAIVEQMAIAAGVSRPDVLVLDDPDLNAYAISDRGRGVIVVTSSLLAALDDHELTGVIAHEMSHLKHRDARVVWLATFGVGMVVALALVATGVAIAAGQAAASEPRSEDDNSSGGAGGVAAIAALFAFVLWVMALPAILLVRASISRRREQLADAAAVQFTRDPYGLRRALEKIAGSHTAPSSVRMSNAALWIANPYSRPSAMPTVARLLDTHPPIERRIAWLRSLEGAETLWSDL